MGVRFLNYILKLHITTYFSLYWASKIGISVTLKTSSSYSNHSFKHIGRVDVDGRPQEKNNAMSYDEMKMLTTIEVCTSEDSNEEKEN